MPIPSNRKFDRLDHLTDEELRQILREDASNPQGEDTDMELVLHVMEVLAKRRNQRSEGRSTAQALDSFNQNYATETDINLISDTGEAFPKRRKMFLFQRIAAVAAVLVLVFTLSAIPASAWNSGFWDTIVTWTKETFHLGHFGQEAAPEEPTPDRAHPCESLQAALDDYAITEKLVPTWIPEGYTESVVDILENPRQRIFFASYQKDDSDIAIQIIDHLRTDSNQIEQSESLCETYISADIPYYFFENNGLLHIVWINGSYECSIFCSLPLEEAKFMIDSIEKG